MIKNFIREEINKAFGKRGTFSRAELFDFYKRFDPELKETTFRWRIYELKKDKVITPVSKRDYTLSIKPVFKPEIDDYEKRIALRIQGQFPHAKYCIWCTSIIKEFMLHQPGKSITVLQVEKDALESAFFLKEKMTLKEIYIQPEPEDMERYVSVANNPVVLLPLISKSPLQTINDVSTLTLEKLLVDLISERKLFLPFQGSEFAHILNYAYHHYSIDFTMLLSYARRRGKETDLMDFITKDSNIPKRIFMND